MNLEVYQVAAKRTLPSLGEKYRLPEDLGIAIDLAHMALGVASELSELEECLGNSNFDKVNLGEELGDKMWYGVNWANILGIKLDFIEIISLWNKTTYDATREVIIYGGQLADIAKRFLAYGASLEDQEKKRMKADNFLTNEEILYNYLASIYEVCDIYSLNIEEIMGRNITKLYVRYPEKFNEDQALVRNLEEERKALEGNV